MGYTVVHDTIPGAASTPNEVQLDAPTGMYVAGLYTNHDGGEPAFYGNPYIPSSTPYYATLVTDGNDRVTGVVVLGDVGETPKDIEAYIICVGDLSGSQPLTAGVGAVSEPAVTANSRIYLEQRTAGGTTAGNVYRVTARTPGTGFTITAVILATGLTGALDTSTIDWHIIEP